MSATNRTFDTDLYDFGLSVRVVNALYRDDITSVAELAKVSQSDSVSLSMIGPHALQEIKQAFANIGQEWPQPSKRSPFNPENLGKVDVTFTKWEYLPVRLEDHDIEHSLNIYGRQGWEMVNFVRLGGSWYEFMFKRLLLEDE